MQNKIDALAHGFIHYADDIMHFAGDAFGLKTTWQQHMFYLSIATPGSRTSVKYAGLCHDSMMEAMAVVALWSMMCKPDSITIFAVKPNSNVGSQLMDHIAKLIRRMLSGSLAPMAKLIKHTKTEVAYGEFPDRQSIILRKVDSKSAINIYGYCRENQMLVALDAAFIDERVINVMFDARCHPSNRIILTQHMDVTVPMKGVFYDTQHGGWPKDGWKALTISAIDNPQVSHEVLINTLDRFCRDSRSPDYRTVILGEYPFKLLELTCGQCEKLLTILNEIKDDGLSGITGWQSPELKDLINTIKMQSVGQ